MGKCPPNSNNNSNKQDVSLAYALRQRENGLMVTKVLIEIRGIYIVNKNTQSPVRNKMANLHSSQNFQEKTHLALGRIQAYAYVQC